MAEHLIQSDAVELSVQETGSGSPVMLLHGLTATRRYVLMGSTALERSGHRVISYDARGHGRSSPARDPDCYGYDRLALDAIAVLDALSIARAVLAGASMGAHTALRLGLQAPDRVAGLVVITPAFDPETNDDPQRLAHWDALAEGLRSGGVEGFLAAYGEPSVPAAWRETVLKVIRQRLSQHEHPSAVADALHAVPRSHPFEHVGELAAISAPVTVVVSADEVDPEHPQSVGEAYAAAIVDSRIVSDEPGRSPVAWQGSQLSRVIGALTAQAVY